MKTLLIGANGQLGTDLRHVLADELLPLDWPELDVRQEVQVRAVLRTQRPQHVINCAAMTDVDACEGDAAEAFAVNAQGALYVARCAEEIHAAVTYISTDYVFGAAGARTEPYDEADTPGPLNVYGSSKLTGEHLTLANNSQGLVIRTCGLYGHAGARGKGTNFVETMLRLAATGQPVRVVDDQRVTPTSTVECAAFIQRLSAQAARGIYHVAAADSCTWFEFAREIFATEGLDVDLQPITSAEFPRRARRPSMSALRSARLESAGVPLCRTWREMLHEYLLARPARRPAPAARSTSAAGFVEKPA